MAWGEVTRTDVASAGAISAARTWWEELSADADIYDEVELPGTGPLAFGSFPFSSTSDAGGVMIVPRFILGVREGTAWLTEVSRTPLTHGPTTEEIAPESPPPTRWSDVTFPPVNSTNWNAAVEKAVGHITSGDVHKVVLSRSVEAHASHPIDPRLLLEPLTREYPTCWSFHIDGMVGATPELLVRVDKNLVISRVLAGTIRPTGDEEADLAHAAKLARSSKDREEHEYAVRSITDVLHRYCSSFNVPEAPSVIHLKNVMHLASDVTGVLDEGTSSLEVVEALHPSAAVCGTPTEQAAALIDNLEEFDRGRYSGPVGWVDAHGDGEWAIALRCGHISSADPRVMTLYAGCGVVAASNPEAEWIESEAKLEPLRSALKQQP